MESSNNREAYLTTLIEKLRPMFSTSGYPLPEGVALRVSCSFPSRLALSSQPALGQCWGGEATTDGSIHLLISPLLSDPVEIAAVLVHELIHASIGTDAKHGPAFTRAMKALGLEGKPTHTVASDALKLDLQRLVEPLGEYPHSAIKPKALESKRQTNRQLKVSCSQDDYILRGAKKTLIEKGIPNCPVCGNILELEVKDDDDSAGDE